MELSVVQQKEQKDILLAALAAFHKICTDNSLTYYACAGTCLGAIRHKGFIPWDDDIDVFMPRSDFERLFDLSEQISKQGYELCSMEKTKGYVLPFAKFCDANTTIWEHKKWECVFGVYIDIFPLDSVSDTAYCRQLFDNVQIYINQYIIATRRYDKAYFIKQLHSYSIKNIIKSCCIVLFRRFFVNCAQRRYSKNLHHIKSQNGDALIYYGGYYGFNKEFLDKKWFKEAVEVPFEKISIRIPIGYDEYLHHLYGDYLTPPPVEKQIPHHSLYFVDFHKRWKIEDILAEGLGSETEIKYTYE